MDVHAAAAWLGLKTRHPYQTLRRWVKQGRLQCGRVGDQMVFTEGQLRAFVFPRQRRWRRV